MYTKYIKENHTSKIGKPRDQRMERQIKECGREKKTGRKEQEEEREGGSERMRYGRRRV